jgi:ubiquinone biosynthesis protein UbiJ
MPEFAVYLLEVGVNRLLRLDPEAAARLAALEGQVVRLEFSDLGAALDVTPSAAGLQLAPAAGAPAAVTLRGTLLGFARLGLSRGEAIVPGTLEVRGDLELGRRFERALQGLEIDWEELLAARTGDVFAHQALRALRGLGRWARAAAGSLERDLGEYLQEEARLLPTRPEVEAFLAAVDELRADADRLERRVQRLLQGAAR